MDELDTWRLALLRTYVQRYTRTGQFEDDVRERTEEHLARVFRLIRRVTRSLASLRWRIEMPVSVMRNETSVLLEKLQLQRRQCEYFCMHVCRYV